MRAAVLALVALAGAPVPGARREVVPASEWHARAQYIASRPGTLGIVAPAHAVAGWSQRSRLLRDGRTEVTVVTTPLAMGSAPHPRERPWPSELERWRMIAGLPVEVATLAEELALGASTQAEVSERVLTWVSLNISHDDRPDLDEAPAAVMSSRRASCVGRSDLAVALLRSAGLPARTLHGALIGEAPRGDLPVTLHRFVETWIDGAGWVPSDPGESIHFVDQRHVVFSLEDPGYDPDSQRGLRIQRAARPDPLTAQKPATSGIAPLVVRPRDITP